MSVNWLAVLLRLADGFLYGTGFVIAVLTYILIWIFIRNLTRHRKNYQRSPGNFSRGK